MRINILGKVIDIESRYDSMTLSEQYERFINELIYYVSVLNRHAYFKDELWKKVREDIDGLELNMAFLARLLSELNIYISPVGSTFTVTNKDKAEKFINQFQDIWIDYAKWCNSQR